MNYEQLLNKLSQDLPSGRPLIPEGWAIYFFIFAILLGLTVIVFIVWPLYNVWRSKKSGQAELEKANFAEQVAIAEARARKNSAEMNREAEIIEAKAVSNSIDVIGKALQENEGYLRWQWIKMMGETENETIYVPTEANLPILEAMRKLDLNGISES